MRYWVVLLLLLLLLLRLTHMVVAICMYEHNEEAESLLLTPFSAPVECSSFSTTTIWQ